MAEEAAVVEATEEPVVTQRLTPAQRHRLLRPLDPRRVHKNPKGYSYIPHNDSRAELIKTFGLCGYALETLNLEQVSLRTNDAANRFWVVYRATVRLTIKDEHGRPLVVYTASGAGSAQNQPNEGDAVDNAIKGAESEAFKRCVLNLGDQYGLSLYDDGALESVGGSLVDSPVIQAARATPAPAQYIDKDGRDRIELLATRIGLKTPGETLYAISIIAGSPCESLALVKAEDGPTILSALDSIGSDATPLSALEAWLGNCKQPTADETLVKALRNKVSTASSQAVLRAVVDDVREQLRMFRLDWTTYSRLMMMAQNRLGELKVPA
jgi:Rad52/22 family double-strand break repair protein